jgi:hypothetical protein
LDVLPGRQDTSMATVRPRLRDGGGEREIITRAMVAQGARHVGGLLIDLAGADTARWEAIIRRLVDLAPPLRALAFERLDNARPQMTPDGRALIWEALRKELKRHEAFASTPWAIPANELRAYQEVTDRFGTNDIVVMTRTVFTDTPMAIRNYDQAMAEQKARRQQALKELYGALGATGVLSVVRGAPQTEHDVADVITDILDDPLALFSLFEAAFADPDLRGFAMMLCGVSFNKSRERPSLQDAWRAQVQRALADGRSPEAVAELCFYWPDTPETWFFLGALGAEVSFAYWRNKPPTRLSAEDVVDGVDFYMAAGRPSAALRASHDQRRDLPAQLILDMLGKLVGEINDGRAQVDTMTTFYVENALATLDERPDVALEQIAQCEFALLPLLEYGQRDLALNRFMAESPDFFFFLIQRVFRAEGEPPSEDATRQDLTNAELSFRLLMKFDKLPGATAQGVDAAALTRWVDAVRVLGQQHGRAAITDQYVGKALAHSTETDPFWPGPIVADEIERLKSKDVETGLSIERFNMRGVTTRSMDDGGAQEWALAAQYAAWAKAASRWRRTRKVLQGIEATWRDMAEREDQEVRLRNARD